MVGLISRFKKKRQSKLPEIMMEDLYNLDTTLAELIAHYLKAFREVVSLSGATPGCFVNEYGDSGWDEWSATIDKMTYAFSEYAKHSNNWEHPLKDLPQEAQDKINEGMHLFIKYFEELNY